MSQRRTVGIDYNHRLARGLRTAVAYDASGTPFNLATNRRGTTSGVVVDGVDGMIGFRRYGSTAGSSYDYVPTNAITIASHPFGATLAVRFRILTNTSSQLIVCLTSVEGYQGRIFIGTAYQNGARLWVYNDNYSIVHDADMGGSSFTVGAWTTVVVSLAGLSAGSSFTSYINGKAVSTVSSLLDFGGTINTVQSGYSGSAALDISASAYWARALSADEALQWSRGDYPYTYEHPATASRFFIVRPAAEVTSGTLSADGSSTAVGAASGVGASTAAAAGTSAGIGAASGTGLAILAAVGTAAGVGAASAVGNSATAAIGTSAGVGAASAVALATATSVGSSAGVGAASGVASAVGAAVGAASGVGAATGVASAVGAGVGVASGVGAASGTATAIGAAVGTAAAVAAASGVGASSGGSASTGAASGVASATGVGAAIVASVGTATAFGASAGVGASTAAAAGVCAAVGAAVGVSVGVSSAVGTASATASATGAATAIIPATGTSAGLSAASGVATGIVVSMGVSVATATATGVAGATSAAVGTVAGVASAAGVGRSTATSVGTATSIASAFGVTFTVAPDYQYVLSELALFLEQQGIGTRAVDLFIGTMPDSGNVIALFEEDGRRHVMTFDKSSVFIERPNVRFIIRSDTYSAARQRAQAVWTAIDSIANERVGVQGTWFLSATVLGSPHIDGRDSRGRVLMTFTAEVDKVPS